MKKTVLHRYESGIKLVRNEYTGEEYFEEPGVSIDVITTTGRIPRLKDLKPLGPKWHGRKLDIQFDDNDVDPWVSYANSLVTEKIDQELVVPLRNKILSVTDPDGNVSSIEIKYSCEFSPVDE